MDVGKDLFRGVQKAVSGTERSGQPVIQTGVIQSVTSIDNPALYEGALECVVQKDDVHAVAGQISTVIWDSRTGELANYTRIAPEAFAAPDPADYELYILQHWISMSSSTDFTRCDSDWQSADATGESFLVSWLDDANGIPPIGAGVASNVPGSLQLPFRFHRATMWRYSIHSRAAAAATFTQAVRLLFLPNGLGPR